jgi:membrane glycosyltransferase
VALITEVLLVSGVALDLVGAGVLSHAHNAESIVELREDIGEEGSAVREDDALSTHAQLLAEKRIGFFLLTVGLVLYLSGLVSKSPEEAATMAPIALGVVLAALVVSLVFTRVVGNRIREQARQAKEQQDPDALPEQ